MLNTLRKGAKSWVAKGLFLLLILSFAAWGIGDYLQPDPAGPVAEVGELEISGQELSRDFNRELERMRQRFGGNIDRGMALQLGLADQILGQAINRRLLDLEARELGIRVSDDLVRDRIVAEPAFAGPTGTFDRDRFEQTLFNNGLTEGDFVAMMRGDLARGMVTQSVVAGAAAPDSVVRLLYADQAEKRVAEVAVLPDTAAGTAPEPSEADLAEAYEKDKQRWMAPEYRAVTAVLLRPEDLMAGAQVSEERLQEAYEARRAEFGTPGTRNVTQLLFTDEAAARKVSERLAAGENFDAVAEEVAGQGAQRTEIGTVTREELFPAAVAEAAFGLAEAGVTEPVQSPLGWHLLRVSDIVPGTTRPFDEVKDTLRDEIARDIAIDRMFEAGNELEDAIAGGASVEEAAAELGLPLVKLPPVTRQGQDQEGQRPAELPTLTGFLETAFSTPSGSSSNMIETREGAYFVLRVEEVIAPRQRPLDEVKDQVTQRWKAERLHEMGAERAAAMAEAVRGGKPLAEVASEAGISAQTLPPVQRSMNDPSQGLPASLVTKLFAANVGDVVVEATPNGHAVARLVEIQKADLTADAEAVEQTRDALSDAIAVDLRAQYLEALRNRYGVSVNQQAVRALFE